jgi:hypothetical protein
MTAAEAFDDLGAHEWAAWVRAQARPCCPDWPHTSDPAELDAITRGWVPVSAGWHVALWVHPDHPGIARPGRHRR